MIDLFLSLFFLAAALVFLGGLLYLLRSLREDRRAPRREPDGGLPVTLGAAGLLVVLAASAVALWNDRPLPSQPVLVVKLTGFQFGWKFEYFEALPSAGDRRFEPDRLRDLGVSSSDHLFLPRGVETMILATSTDVIHRLEVPELRVNRDLIPGLVSPFPVRPPRAGRYLLLSDGLCGAALGLMVAQVTVLEPASFQRWLAGGEEES